MGEAHSTPAHVTYSPREDVLTEIEFIDPSMCLFKNISASPHFCLSCGLMRSQFCLDSGATSWLLHP